MVKRKSLTLILIALFAVMAIAVILSKTEYWKNRNIHIVGDNPLDIPISDLPACNYTGEGYLETPCYEHNDAVNE